MKYKIVNSEKEEGAPEKKNYRIIDPEWSLEEIILPIKIKEEIEDIVSFIKSKEEIINLWELSKFLKSKGCSIGINFYGVAGTGKSILAEGLASATGRKLIRADYSEITDSLLGGTEKKLSELFDLAEGNNAIIFFDEADGLISKRSMGSKASENTNQIKSHLLNLLDKSKAIVIFATNLFENYDKAFFRRILFHVGFRLPDIEQRVDLWKFHLTEKIPKDISYNRLGELSESLSGGDIKNITLKLCIKLSAKRITTIDETSVIDTIEKYRNAVSAMEYSEITPKL